MDRLCGLYARVSTEMQANIRDSSVDTQISQMKNFILTTCKWVLQVVQAACRREPGQEEPSWQVSSSQRTGWHHSCRTFPAEAVRPQLTPPGTVIAVRAIRPIRP